MHAFSYTFTSFHSSLIATPLPNLSNNMEDTIEASEKGTLKSSYTWNQRQGGFRATSFIFGMVGLENMGFIANMASMVLYFMMVMCFHMSEAATTITNFLGSAFLLSIVGGFISDAYLTRLNTCIIFGVVEVLGLMMVTFQAHYKSLQPAAPCGESSCITGAKSIFLYTSLALLAIGSGGVRGSLPALGADQFNAKDPKEKKYISTYFNFLLLSITTGATLGVTVIVWVSMNKGWDLGFFISMLSLVLGFTVLILGKPFYRNRVPGDSPILRIVQVLVVAFGNRGEPLPEKAEELYEVHDKQVTSEIHKISHSKQFRCLDKAAIMKQGTETNEWNICTVTQVEEVKILTRMMPILLSTILMNTCLAQLSTFSVQQGAIMNLQLGSFPVPAPSIPVIPLVFMSILIPIYEYSFVPFARKITKHPAGITHLQRVGVGLVLSIISMGVAAMVEVKRRNAANNNLHKISLFWLSFQYGIFGIADMFTLVGLLDFFYSEAPAGMRSLSTSFTFLSLSFGYFLSSVFVSIINAITERMTKSKQGWLSGNDLNSSKLDLFYWFLAILSCLNFANYVYWAIWYKYKVESTEEDVASNASSFHKTETTQGSVEPETKANSSPSSNGESKEDKEQSPVVKHEIPQSTDGK